MTDANAAIVDEATTSQAHGADSNPHDHSHGLPDRGYVRIAAILAVLTAIEVAISYMGLPHAAELSGLLVIMAIKFVVVASNFMHLKFDDKLLTRIFYAGLFLAVAVYMAALTTMHVFW